MSTFQTPPSSDVTVIQIGDPQFPDPIVGPPVRPLPIRFPPETPPRNVIKGIEASEEISGTAQDEDIFALGGDDTIFASPGNDFIDGGAGIDTIDYAKIGQPITLVIRGSAGGGLTTPTTNQLRNVEIIAGAAGQINTIDGSRNFTFISLSVDLSQPDGILKIRDSSGSSQLIVRNFVNVTGTLGNDEIAGSDANNLLDGRSGNDTLIGSRGSDTLLGRSGNDVLIGVDNIDRGTGEIDTLTGGLGNDVFVLGDNIGSFYRSLGAFDVANITDFTANDQLRLGAGSVFRIERTDIGFTLFAKDEEVFDQIANITFGQGATSPPPVFSPLTNDLSLDAIAKSSGGTFTIASGETKGIFVGA